MKVLIIVASLAQLQHLTEPKICHIPHQLDLMDQLILPLPEPMEPVRINPDLIDPLKDLMDLMDLTFLPDLMNRQMEQMAFQIQDLRLAVERFPAQKIYFPDQIRIFSPKSIRKPIRIHFWKKKRQWPRIRWLG